jgi:outer membrane protein OmpA-like peptidoglycan-associated protein
MSKCRPSKWILPGIIGAGLPWLCASWLSSGATVADINGRALGALSGNDLTKWAKVENDGRDATISGTAPSEDAVAAAVKAVAGTYGVRTVAKNVSVVAPVALVAPTVESLPVTNMAMPTFKGTFPEAQASGFNVKVGDDTYVWKKDKELQTDGAGNWTLTPSKPLPEGMVHVEPTVMDAAGVALAAAAAGMATIDLTPPAAPTLTAAAPDAKWPYPISGTWAEEPGSKLVASLNGATYALGTAPELTSDGKGNFTFAPNVELKPGSYDIDFTTNDAAGNVLTQTLKAAIVIPEAAAAPAPAPAAEPAKKPAKLGVVAYSSKPATAWPYPITGTWSETKGNTLTATVAGRSYVAGRGAALTSDGKGVFTFAPSAKLAPGSYDVDFTVNDAAGNVAKYTAPAAIVVPEPAPPPPPAPPPVKLEIIASAPAADGRTITGTWTEAAGTTLTATLAGREYVANRGAALTTDGKGTYTFAPAAKLAPGTYPVEFMVMDGTGQMVTTTSQIVVAEAPKVAEPAPAPAPAAKPEMAAPTVTKQLDLTGAPIVKGTWPSDMAKALTVTLNGKTYTLGQDANLGTKNGNWSLLPSAGLKDGIYDVSVVATDADGVAKKDETVAEVEVDGVPPATPTVVVYEGVKSPESITGTYDAKQATGLKVSVPSVNVTAELGKADSGLTADGDGNWTLKLLTPLAPGKYDVNAESSDVHGRMQADATAGELVITAPPGAPAAYDCLAVLNRVDAIFPIRFAFDIDAVKPPYDLTLKYYSAVLKDPRCANVKVEVGGHADSRGSVRYNQDLSERRAQNIIDMLAKEGVDASRLVKKGYSEEKPLDPATTNEARMKNRRVEITATSN